MAGVTALASPVPWPVRLIVCLAVAVTGTRAVRETILLKGPRAVRGLTWSAAGELQAWIGGAAGSLAVERAAGAFRLGPSLLVLRLESARGVHTVCIDGTIHDPSAFRGLCRVLRRPVRRPS